jgi:S1-C subfamily serine protease
MDKTSSSALKIIILAVIFGLGAGIVGQIIATAYLLPGETLLSSGQSIVKQAASLSAENEKILGAEQAVSPAVFEIFSQKNPSHDPQNQIYLAGDRVALGFALTTDGWLISYGKNLIDPKNHFVILTSDQKIFSPQKTIFDEATGVVFIKIDAQNLTIPKFGTKKNLSLAEKIVVPESKQSFNVLQTTNLSYKEISSTKDLFNSSENFSGTILFNQTLKTNEVGAPAVNLSGEVTGIISDPSLAAAVPIDFWRNSFLNLLKTEKIVRPYLGVSYIDLSKAPGINEALSQGKTVGALVWGDKTSQISGVVKNSPAEKSGLKDGDIILKINDDELNQKITLPELIANYAPGDKIQITALRSGEEKIFEATLGEK